MNISSYTGTDNYFEDFAPGAVYRHARGKTVNENEAVTLCHMVMNTAPGHFNDHMMEDTPVGESLVYGGVTISIVIGLAYQDTGEQVIQELSMDNIKLLSPVKHGDTLYAYSEVLEVQDRDENSGLITFRHYGVDQDSNVVFQGERRAVIRKRPKYHDSLLV